MASSQPNRIAGTTRVNMRITYVIIAKVKIGAVTATASGTLDVSGGRTYPGGNVGVPALESILTGRLFGEKTEVECWNTQIRSIIRCVANPKCLD
jgi:hypothetical protein